MEEEGGSILIYILFGIAYIILQVVGAKKSKKPRRPVPPQTIPDMEELPDDATWEDETAETPVPDASSPHAPVPSPPETVTVTEMVKEPVTIPAAPFSYDDDITQDYFERARGERKPDSFGKVWEKIAKKAEALRNTSADTADMTSESGVLDDFDARKAILYAEILRPKFDGDQEADRF